MTSTSLEPQRPFIALVGRPNVGKSTLFNRLIGTRKAIVSSIRGTTRDRVYGQAEWRGIRLTLIDTGGVEFATSNGLGEAIQRHIRRALEEADGFILVCDAQEGVVPADEMLLERLRKTGKPIVLAANKADHRPVIPPEFFSLGLSPMFAVSALHGRGTGELLDHLVNSVGETPAPPDAKPRFPAAAVAILGRQNVGKSSLLNALLREERVIVSELPGTTRDAVDTHLTVNGEPVTLIDTAGLRHRRKVKSPIDLFSMSRALDAIARCDVALVVLDATQGPTRDDQRIITQVCREGCGLVLLVNKWDLIRGGSERKLTDAIRRLMPSAAFAPVLAISAKTGFQVQRSLAIALQVVRTMKRGLPEAECFALLQSAWSAHLPPRFRGRAVRLQQVRWLAGRPVRVELVTTPVGRLTMPYQHYLLKRLYASTRLSGVPVELTVRSPERRSPQTRVSGS